jgi:hypothetical protein
LIRRQQLILRRMGQVTPPAPEPLVASAPEAPQENESAEPATELPEPVADEPPPTPADPAPAEPAALAEPASQPAEQPAAPQP